MLISKEVIQKDEKVLGKEGIFFLIRQEDTIYRCHQCHLRQVYNQICGEAQPGGDASRKKNPLQVKTTHQVI